MKILTSKKFLFSFLLILIYQFIAIPIKLFAALPPYQPLEGQAFEGFGLTSTNDLPDFLAASFNFGLALAAALSVIMIVWGGVEYMLSDSLFSKDEGKKKIWNAIWGLGLALVSWLILYTINPELLNFKLN